MSENLFPAEPLDDRTDGGLWTGVGLGAGVALLAAAVLGRLLGVPLPF
jgi:hypothetical protein